MSIPQYWLPTSKGALYATQAPASNPVRNLLLALMGHVISPHASLDQIAMWSGVTHPGLAASMVLRMLVSGLVETIESPYHLQGSISDKKLSEQLSRACAKGKTLLADRQGFCLASAGFLPHEIDGLAGLCAEMASLRLRQNASPDTPPCALVEAWHCKRLGSAEDCRLQPLFIGPHQFTLLMSGEPRLDNRALADMIWTMIQRYGTPTQPSPSITPSITKEIHA